MTAPARIAPADAPFSPAVQQVLDRVMPPGVPPLRLFTTLARDERLFQKFFNASLLDRGHLTLRQRELVIDRTTARCGSEYEWGVHVAFFAAKAGLDAEQVASLAEGRADDACWRNSDHSDDDRLLIALCDALHDTCDVDDALWQRLHARFSDEAVLELLMLAGFYRTVSMLTNALRLPSEAMGARFPSRAHRGSASRDATSPRGV
jgi:alkylhydroperoxidase family enzyme